MLVNISVLIYRKCRNHLHTFLGVMYSLLIAPCTFCLGGNLTGWLPEETRALVYSELCPDVVIYLGFFCGRGRVSL